MRLIRDCVLPHHLDLGRRELANLTADGVEVALPAGKELVQVVPVLHGERSVHRRRDLNALVGLVELGTNQLCFQH